MRRLPAFCFSRSFFLTRNIAAVTFRQNVFTQGFDVFAGDNLAADGGLDGDVEHLAWNQFAHFRCQLAASVNRALTVDNQAQGIDFFRR